MRTLFLFIFSAICSPLFSQEKSRDYQLLWEVKQKGKKPSYIFGSMHSNDPRLFNFPDSVYYAFEQVDAVVLETDVTQIYDEYDVRLNLFNFDFFGEKRSYATSRDATQTVYGSEDGRPQFLDAYFQQTGFCAGKKFFPLETVQDQLKLGEHLSIFNTRIGLNTLFITKETMLQTYIKGDIAALSNLLKTQFKGSPEAYNELITKRNKVMANGLDTLMRKQSVFCAIGSGHLYGNDGVLQLLSMKGFQIRSVKANFDNTTVEAKKKVLSWRKYELKNETYNFQAVFSGKPVEITDDLDSEYRCIYQELGQGNTYEIVVYKNSHHLDDKRYNFVENKQVKTNEFSVYDNVDVIEGIVKHPLKGYQWKRIIQCENIAYELICYGGNKFMHSDRPMKFFQTFSFLDLQIK